MLEQLLGENALARCTIVFTHCKVKDINRAKCIEANRDSPRIVSMLEKAHSIIFGDMDTFDDDDSDVETRNRINQSQAKRRQHFMEQLLPQVDNTDDKVLTSDESWLRSYWTRFTQYISYCAKKIFGKPNELSKRYRLTAALKKEIPVTIYYESCSICLDLILEIWNTEPKACITKCGHIFHYNCLEEWFTKKKECPNCRADLRSLPERMVGQRIGLHSISEELKTPPAAPSVATPTTSLAVPPVVLSAPLLRPPTPLGEVEELMSTEESNNASSIE
ncbi:unnamed protein product [Rotaria sordida]|uniref:RING-type domain-containing protein n=1 Tax=Rotaria sordida TaxID=392033 RepID=A0A818XGM5_9BILA|nr:unnamed protein product [Rotaria sordida]